MKDAKEIRDLSVSEVAFINFIRENADLISAGDTDWDILRAFAIQICVEKNIAENKSNPVEQACMANGVNKAYYSRNKIFEVAAAIRKLS